LIDCDVPIASKIVLTESDSVPKLRVAACMDRPQGSRNKSDQCVLECSVLKVAIKKNVCVGWLWLTGAGLVVIFDCLNCLAYTVNKGKITNVSLIVEEPRVFLVTLVEITLASMGSVRIAKKGRNPGCEFVKVDSF